MVKKVLLVLVVILVFGLVVVAGRFMLEVIKHNKRYSGYSEQYAEYDKCMKKCKAEHPQDSYTCPCVHPPDR